MKHLFIVLLFSLPLRAAEFSLTKKTPSKENCGAAVSKRGLVADTFERAIECMKAGYKDVYLGGISGVIYERIPEEYDSKKIQLIILPDGGFILYTKKGEKNAELLAKAIEEKYHNAYLRGCLLGYDEEDIKYFYERDKDQTFNEDKAAAQKWIAKNTKKESKASKPKP